LIALNGQLGGYARFAGYDQLLSFVAAGSTTQIANVTRYCGDILSLLRAEFVIDGRHEVTANRLYISEAYWKSRFAKAPNIIGAPVRCNGGDFEIAGVIRVRESFLSETDVWAPVGIRGPYGSMTSLRLIGELLPGQDWRVGEKSLALLMKARPLREQIMDFDTVRLLPIDRRLLFFASHPVEPPVYRLPG
jgi:hypothetical protein